MRTTNLKPTMSPGRRLSWMVGLAFTLLVVGHAQSSFGQTSQPKTFSSPSEASSALFQAVQSEDEQAVEAILGAGKEVTSSSDAVEDKLEHEQFSQKYQEMHRLVREPDGSTVLYIGAENWPFPIPLVSKNGEWYFDSDRGKREILFRRIGENEATAIQVCHGVAKTKEHSETKTTGDDPIIQYARSLVSGGAANVDGGARDTDKQSSLFHGYYFRLVTGNTAAGSNSRVSGSRKTETLALVAFPADYRSSGVMTFIVTKNGTVYEKDLGPKTTAVARNLDRGP